MIRFNLGIVALLHLNTNLAQIPTFLSAGEGQKSSTSLFVWALEIPVMGHPFFRDLASSPRGGVVGASLPGLINGTQSSPGIGEEKTNNPNS